MRILKLIKKFIKRELIIISIDNKIMEVVSGKYNKEELRVIANKLFLEVHC